MDNEKNLSAKQCIEEEDSRISGPDVDKERKIDYKEKTSKRTQEIGGTDSRKIVNSAFSFRKEERLRKRQDFLRLYTTGRKCHTDHFIIVWSCKNDGKKRLGVTVSRRTGKAVARNRIKRYLREYFRQHKELFQKADYNVIAKNGSDQLRFQEVCLELDKALGDILFNMKC